MQSNDRRAGEYLHQVPNFEGSVVNHQVHRRQVRDPASASPVAIDDVDHLPFGIAELRQTDRRDAGIEPGGGMSDGRSRLDVKADRLSSEALDQRCGGFRIDDEVQVANVLLEPGEQARIHHNTLEG